MSEYDFLKIPVPHNVVILDSFEKSVWVDGERVVCTLWKVTAINENGKHIEKQRMYKRKGYAERMQRYFISKYG